MSGKKVLLTLLIFAGMGAASVPKGKANVPRYNPATEVTV